MIEWSSKKCYQNEAGFLQISKEQWSFDKYKLVKKNVKKVVWNVKA